MLVRACAALLVLAAATEPGRAESCDGLAARVIRLTGASLAGREGTRAVFRATDAERMSLECRAPARMVFAALDREPPRAFYALIGRAAQALVRAPAAETESLALRLHQDSLLADAPRRGTAGRAALRCETGPRADAFPEARTLCVLVADPPARRRGGLSRGAAAG